MSEITISPTNKGIITRMINAGKPFGTIKSAMLALDMVENAEQADKYLKKNTSLKKGRRGVSDKMHDFLKESPRTQQEFYDWIMQNGTDSMWKMRSHHDKVRELTVALFVKLGKVDFTEVPYVETDTESAEDTEEDNQEAA